MHKPDHIPVLLNEVVKALDLNGREVIVDATYGRGGHANAVLGLLPPTAKLVVIDRDPCAITHAKSSIAKDPRVEAVHGRFSKLGEILQERGILGEVDAILFDLGVSSPQLDVSERGFSFNSDGPLDMRMDRSRGVPAAQWIADVEERELVRILKRYGEERFAKRISGRIKQALETGKIETTAELCKIVSDAVPVKEKHKHPATRTFQAIRIAVNEELREIEKVLPLVMNALAPNGRIVIISFHSLEDRIVKRFLKKQSRGDPYPPDLPVRSEMIKPKLKLIGRPVKADAREVEANPRARSAILRVAQKAGRQGAEVQ